MKNRIAFVCIGQAAGNIGDLLAEKGYNVFAINTSKEDISTLRNVKHTYHIPGGLGCSKDRDVAKKMLATSYEQIVDQLRSYVTEDIIYFIFSAGGGTGSGFSPWFIDILVNDVFVEHDPDYPDEIIRTRTVGAVTILASETESPRARENTYNCLGELSSIDGLCNIFLIDNDGQGDLRTVNKIFVDLLDSVLTIPEKHKSREGNIDTSEIVKGFSTPGLSVIAKVGSKANMSSILEKLRSSIFAELDRDPDSKTISFVLSSTIKPLDYSTIVAEFGQYVDEFHTFNQECNLVMLTGLPFPKARVNRIEEHLREDASRLSTQNKNNSSTVLKSELNLLGGAVTRTVPRREPESPENPKTSRRDELLARIRKR